MKRLMTFMLAALLSLGVASVSLAQEGAAGGQPAGSDQPAAKAKTKSGKKHGKKSGKKGKKKGSDAEEPMK